MIKKTSILYPFGNIIEYKIPYRKPINQNTQLIDDNIDYHQYTDNNSLDKRCNDCGYYCDMLGGSICHDCKIMCSKLGGTICHYCKKKYKLINGHYYHTCKDQKKIENDIKNRSRQYYRYDKNNISQLSNIFYNLRDLQNNNQQSTISSIRNNNISNSNI